MGLPFFPQPKPSAKLKDKTAAKRADDVQALMFRAAVWRRGHSHCQVCGRPVKRTLELCANRGEVHHLRGRNVTPEDRYCVEKARLVCLECHGKLQRHEIRVK